MDISTLPTSDRADDDVQEIRTVKERGDLQTTRKRERNWQTKVHTQVLFRVAWNTQTREREPDWA